MKADWWEDQCRPFGQEDIRAADARVDRWQKRLNRAKRELKTAKEIQEAVELCLRRPKSITAHFLTKKYPTTNDIDETRAPPRPPRELTQIERVLALQNRSGK
jgi:hypothetical protein